MAQKRKRAFDGLYAQLEETDGNVVLFSAKGEPSVIFEMTNPVQQLCTDAEQYLRFQDVLSGVVQTLGEGYALQKQDILCKQSYRHEVPENAEFLTKSYFRYFEGREFTEIRTFLIITQEARRGQFVQYDPKRWLDFHSKVAKVDDILKEKGIKHRKLSKAEVNEYCHRFMAFRFRHGPFSMTNFKASDEYLKTGGRVIRSYPLVDIDEINLPSVIKPYTQMSINGYGIATDLLSFLTQIPFSDCVVFNQVVQIPEQRKLLRNIKYHCLFRSEGLPAAFRKFSRISKIWVFRPRSLTSYLPYPPFVRSVGNARKTVLPTKKLKKSFTKGKRIGTLKTKDYASKKNDYRTREESGYQPLFQLSQDWKRKRHEKAVLRL